ncbi:MAG: HlyD family secretion protein, partial [Rhizobiaceae bacterium]
MSTSQSTSAEVRPFPNPKSAPEAREPLPEIPAAEPVVEVPHAPTTEKAPAQPRKGSTRRFILPVIGIAALAAAGWFGYKYWTVGRFMVSTDDAYVQADMAFISPKITGYVEDVKFDNNQRVKAGQPLIVIDNGDYRIALDQTQAKIDSQDKTLERIKAQIVAAQASVQQAEAQKVATQAAANNAARTQKRAEQLVSSHVASQSTLDDARTAVEQANANLVGADAQIAAAKANIGVLQAQYNEAESSLASLKLAQDKAARDLSFTVIKAPFDGVMGNRSVQKGDLVNPGQKLANLVPTRHLYIVANYKETQLPGIAAGAKVHVRVDAMDGEGFDGI